jgi:iron complex outermembrane recepter protein
VLQNKKIAMWYRYIYSLSLVFLLSHLAATAQTRIYGRVLAADNTPLLGALIVAPTHNSHAITDEEGKFQLLICGDCVEAEGHLIEVSYIGYEPQKLVVNSFTPLPIAITMKELQLATVLVDGSDLLLQPNTGVSQADLMRNIQGTLSASLDRVAGVNSMNVGVGIAKPVIRGLSGNRISIQHDGTKQEGQQWGGDHGLEIDALDVQNIQVIKGANALRYGSDALGGVLLISSAEPPRLARYLSASLQTIYKTNNQHVGVSAHIAARRGKYWAEARYTFQSFGDYHLPADSFIYNGYQLPIYAQTLKNTAGEEQNARLSFGYLGNRWHSNFNISLYSIDAGIFLGAVGVPRAYNLQPDESSRNRSNPRQNVAHYKLNWQNIIFFSDDWHLHAQAAYQYNRRQEYSFPDLHNRPLPTTQNNNLALQLDLHTIATNLALEYTPNTKTSQTIGCQSQIQYNSSSGFDFLLPNYQTQQIGIFWLHEYNPNPRNQYSVGIRADYAATQTADFKQLVYNADQTGTIWQPRANANQRQFFNYAAAAAWKHQLSSQQFFNLHLGKTFRSPSPNELAADGIHHGTFRHERGNANLRPEQGYQLDFSHQYSSRNSRFDVQTAAFFNYFDGFIYLRPSARFSPLPEGGQIYQYSQNNAIFTGGELVWTWQPLAHARQWQIAQTYEAVLSHNINTGLSLPFTPPANILTDISYSFSSKRPKGSRPELFLRLSHWYYLAQNRVDRNEKATPQYMLFNAVATLQLHFGKQKLQINLQAQNLFNTPYLQHLSRYRLLSLPEQGRNLILALSFSF